MGMEMMMAIALPALGAILSGVTGLGSAVSGAVGNSKARKRERKLRERQEALDRGLYHRDYYGDYTRRADVQAGLAAMREALKEQSQRDRNRAVITGATGEASSAMKEGQNRAIGAFMRDMASRGMAFKDRATDRYIQGNRLSDQINYNQLARRAESSGNLMYNGLRGLAGINWGNVLSGGAGGGLQSLKSPTLWRKPNVNIGGIEGLKSFRR